MKKEDLNPPFSFHIINYQPKSFIVLGAGVFGNGLRFLSRIRNGSVWVTTPIHGHTICLTEETFDNQSFLVNQADNYLAGTLS